LFKLKIISNKKLLGYSLLSLVFSVLWSIRLATDWGGDFGLYYAGAMFIDNEYRLYNEFFSHKGPVYFIFLKLIGAIIGYGGAQAIVSILLTTLTYFLSIVLLIKDSKWEFGTLILFISAGLMMLTNSHASIGLFLVSQILLVYFFAMKYLETGFQKYNIVMSLIAFSAFFTRIDALIYPVWVLSNIILHSCLTTSSLKFRTFFLGVITSFLSGFSLFLVLSWVLNFSISDWYQANIIFNIHYKTFIGACDGSIFACKPHQFKMLLSSGFLIVGSYVFVRSMYLFNWYDFKLFFQSGRFCLSQIQIKMCSILIFMLLVSVVWTYSGSDKNYHVFIIAVAFIVPIIHFGNDFFNRPLFIAIIISTWPSLSISYIDTIKRLQHYKCLVEPYCLSSGTSNAVKLLESSDVKFLIGGEGWPYVFSKTKPVISINDWWLYVGQSMKEQRIKPIHTDNSFKSFSIIMNLPSGTSVLLNKWFFNDLHKSQYASKVKANFSLVKDTGNYYLMKKK
jgi:hypothetical protein